MHIQWLGQSAFKIQDKEVTIAIDPHDKIGIKMPKFQADILIVTHAHDDHNNIKAIKGNPFLINGAGEYEVKNVFVYGLRSWHDNKKGEDQGLNIIYVLEIAGVKIAHLGDLGQENLNERQLGILEGVDILLIPVGGEETINGIGAVKIISQIQPRIVIPMHYKIPGNKMKLESVDKFLKEFGVSNPEKTDKLKISKKDLPQEETKVIILNKS
jgi:L-ascorbate metabolism protein UlaG (beta-lactamase superfamily)